MEHDNIHEMAEYHSLPAYGPARRYQAPVSLLASLEKRIKQYNHALTHPATPEELVAESRHEQWEIRCAAIERLGAIQHHAALTTLENALNDDHYQVRIAALKALGQFGASAPLSPLLNALKDPNWQVREMAVLTLAGLPQMPLMSLRAAEHDANSRVREAATRAVCKYDSVSQSTRDTEKKEQGGKLVHMNSTIRNIPRATGTPLAEQQTLLPHRTSRWRGRGKLRVLALGAAAMLLLVLTAAGTYAGWWDTIFGGNAQIYQSIEQQQTDQGVTITVRKAYADEGRTIIVYDITADPAVDFVVDNATLTGSAPQKSLTLLGTSCSAPDQGVRHCYAILPAFLVPPDERTLRLTWDISRLIVNVRDPHTQVLVGRNLVKEVSEKEGVSENNFFLVGNWHFSFSVPFHHENRNDVPSPLK